MYICFHIITYIYLYLISAVQVVCHFNILLTEAVVSLLYLEHLVPLLIWILASCPFYINRRMKIYHYNYDIYIYSLDNI